MTWQEIEARVAHLFVRKAYTGEAMPDLDLFDEKPQRATATSNAGRPRVPLRVMIALLYLKHAFNESDEGVVQRWADVPRWQFFSGCVLRRPPALRRHHLGQVPAIAGRRRRRP